MRLNPVKCNFRVGGDKFLSFMITHRWIEANSDKCIAILEMHSLTNIQEVQKLNGRLASLFRFLPKRSRKSEAILQTAQENWALFMGRDLRTSLSDFQENHSHTASFELTRARSTGAPISLNSQRSHQLSPRTREREEWAPYLLHQSHAPWCWEALPNDRKGGVNTHHLGLTTWALLPESSSGSQDELPHQAGFEKAWTHRKNGGLVRRNFRVWHLVRTTWSHEDTIHGWLSDKIHRKWQNHPRLVDPLCWRCVQCKRKRGRDHPRRPWLYHFRASAQAQLQSLKQPGRVWGAHCRSKVSKRSWGQVATMLHRLTTCPRIGCQHIPNQGNSTAKVSHR